MAYGDYAIRPKDEEKPVKFEGRILVPFAVESALSGVRRPLTPAQRLWYRRTFSARKPAGGGRLLAHFEAVDWRAEVFVNGKRVGVHEGGYDPFTFDITAALRPGATQEMVVAVWDPTDQGAQPRGKQVLEPNGIWYTAVSGIWRTVWIEPVPAAHATALRMVPDLDGRSLRLTVSSAENGSFTARALFEGKPVGRQPAPLTGRSWSRCPKSTPGHPPGRRSMIWKSDFPAATRLKATSAYAKSRSARPRTASNGCFSMASRCS